METILSRVLLGVCAGMMDTLELDLVNPAAKDPAFKPDEAMMAEIQEHLRACPRCRHNISMAVSTLNQSLQKMVDDSNMLKNKMEAYQEVLTKATSA